MTVRMTELSSDKLGELTEALAACGLPTADVRDPGRIFFRCERDGAVGFVGLEGHGPDRLLRSLVVPKSQRQGFGSAILDEIERHAVTGGVERLHILTTTAAEFFRRRGYEASSRTTAPKTIAATAEFSTLCPDSAAYLVKRL